MELIILAAAAAIAAPSQVAQQQPAAPAPAERVRTVQAVRATAAPAIDGRAGDDVWQSAPRMSDFVVFDPNEGAEPSFRTEFQVAYDERNLYVFVRAFDPHPDSIMHALSRRDVRGPSDQLVVFVDSYNDRRTGFEFAVNPDGVKRDYAVYNDNNEDGSWNGIWDVETQVDSLGWTAEYRIPLSQLRYADAPMHTFGFGVFRDIERYRERLSWPAISRNRQGMASQMGTLEGLAGLTGSRAVELTPYTVVKNDARALGGNRFERSQSFTAGADVKFRITPNVTLDATVNPDFGQVEADPAVLNLSAFETFLSERRPFFVEGTGIYRFALNCYIVVDCNTNEGLFYSRRIGRSPTLRNLYGDPTTPTSTPIAAAMKLTGRTRSGLSFGVLDAVTPHVEGVDGASVEPRTNHAVLSIAQDFNGGNAGISLIGTAVNRAMDEWTESFMHSNAYAAGLSARSRMFGGNYEVAASLAASRIAGTAEVIDRTQRNGVHYYQQPDDDLEYDPTRTSLTGHAGQVKFGKYGGGITRFETSFVRQSAGFDVNDLGFLRRADLQDWSTWAALNFNDPRGVYRWLRFNGNHWQTWNTSGRRLNTAFNGNGHMGLHNNWDVHAGATVDGIGETYCDRCTRGGPVLRRSAGFYPWFGVNADSRRTLAPSMWVNLGYSDEGKTETVSLSPSLNIRISTRLQASVGAGLTHNQLNTQWVGNFTDNGETSYVFAHLDQETRSLNLRLNYTAGPDLTFEFYGQPFISTGTYTDFREISSTPDAAEYDDRFITYDASPDISRGFAFRQLRTNAVARWEYRPGSTVFLVWAHGRSHDQNRPSERTWSDEYNGLFDLYPQNTFLVKFAYWFNR